MIDLNLHLKSISSIISEITVDNAYKEMSESSLLIDIREADEVNAGSPVNALRISKGMLEMQILQHAPESETKLMVMCASGKRSLIAAHSLYQMGFNNVFSVKGGFNEWKQRALPFEVPAKLSKDDTERYKRHTLIPEVGEKGQLKLLASKVLIVGAGGIGSPIACYLTAAGIGTLGIIDNDIVDKSNLQRQILFSEKGVGFSKVEGAKKRLTELNSAIRIVTYNERLTADNIDNIVSNYDIVIDGTDNFNTRYLVNDACVKFGIPNIHGSVFMFEGQFSTFWPASEEGGPCYRCLFPAPPPAELAPSCAEAGVLGVLPGIIGLMCATEAIKVILGIGENQVGRLLVYDALTMEFNTFKIDKRKDCPYCSCNNLTSYPAYSNYSESCSV